MWHLWEELCPIIAHHSVQGWPPPPSFCISLNSFGGCFCFLLSILVMRLVIDCFVFLIVLLNKKQKKQKKLVDVVKNINEKKKGGVCSYLPVFAVFDRNDLGPHPVGFLLVKNLPTVQNVSEMLQSFQLLHFRKTCRGKQERWKCDNIIYCRRIVLPSEQGQTNKPSILNRCYFGVETEMKDEETVILNKHPEQNLLVFHV